MEGFLLVQLLNERYIEKNGSIDSKVSLKNFKKDNREKVTDFLKALGLEEFLGDFKNKSYSGDGYWFFEEERTFIIEILDLSKKDKYRLIRERKYQKLSDDEAIKLFEYIYQMLVRRGFERNDLNRRIEGPYNLLDYPVRRINRKIIKIKTELDGIQKFMFKQKNKLLTSSNDNFAWIQYVEQDLKKQINRYEKLFMTMHTNRREEISDLSGVQYFTMSEKEHEIMFNEKELTNRIYSIYMDMDEVKPLLEEENKIMGVPNIHSKEFRKYIPREDYTLAEEKQLKKILNKKRKCYDIATQQAVSEIAMERGVSEEEVTKEVVMDWTGLITSEELLKLSLDETK